MKDSGGLNFESTNSTVSLESYALAATNLAICVICALMLLPKCRLMMFEKNTSTSMKKCVYMMIILALNIAYSAVVIMYYDSKKPIDKFMHNVSMSMVVLGSFFTALYFSPFSKVVY